MPSLNEVVEALIERLDDEDTGVVNAAASAIKKIGDQAIPQLLEVLSVAPILHRDSIVRVLSELGMPESEVLRPIRREMEAAYALVAQQATLQSLEASTARDFLLEALKTDITAIVGTVFRLLRATGLDREMDLVERALLSRDKRTAAVAVEGIEKVVHKDFRWMLVPLLEEVPINERLAVSTKAFGISPPSMGELLKSFLDSGDSVFQIGACALLEERNEFQEWRPALESLHSEAPPEVVSQIRSLSIGGAGGSELMTTLEKVLFLRKVDIFQALDVRALTAISTIAEERPVEKGEVLFKEGELGDSMFCVLEGSIKVLKERVDGTYLELAEVGPPEVLGEMALFEEKPRSATLQVHQKGRVLEISQMAFQGIMHDYPQVSVHALRLLCRRLREAGDRVRKLREGSTTSERRGSPRVGSDLEATLEGTRKASLQDISIGGAYLVEKVPSAPGQHLSLSVEVPGHGPLALEGTVRRSELSPDGIGFGLALAFDQLPEGSSQVLKKWLDTQLMPEG